MNSLIASKQTTNLPIKTLENDLDTVILSTLNSVLVEEIKSLENLVQAIPQESLELVKMILATSGRIVFSGIGKSGLIARKLVATFSSMGKAALFLHPTEALHGDLGMVHPQDLFIILSKS